MLVTKEAGLETIKEEHYDVLHAKGSHIEKLESKLEHA